MAKVWKCRRVLFQLSSLFGRDACTAHLYRDSNQEHCFETFIFISLMFVQHFFSYLFWLFCISVSTPYVFLGGGCFLWTERNWMVAIFGIILRLECELRATMLLSVRPYVNCSTCLQFVPNHAIKLREKPNNIRMHRVNTITKIPLSSFRQTITIAKFQTRDERSSHWFRCKIFDPIIPPPVPWMLQCFAYIA